jgi:hypothetical protein
MPLLHYYPIVKLPAHSTGSFHTGPVEEGDGSEMQPCEGLDYVSEFSCPTFAR